MSPPPPPSPRIRRPRALLALALAAPLLLAATQLRLQPRDQGLLLDVAGTPVDAIGRLQGAWQWLARDCGTVWRPRAGSPVWQAAQRVLAAHSPPASAGARPLQLLQQGDWLLAELRWDGPGAAGATAPLDPAIVPLRRIDGRWQVQEAGVWSGDTGPWAAAPRIPGRRFLQSPGPSPVPDEVLHAMSASQWTWPTRGGRHGRRLRGRPARRLVTARCRVFMYAANGHGAWEVAMENLLPPGAGGADPRHRPLQRPVGDAGRGAGPAHGAHALARRPPDRPDDMARALRDDRSTPSSAVFAVHTDTASGVTSDMDALRRGRRLRASGAAGGRRVASLGCGPAGHGQRSADVVWAPARRA
jgi:hypothetical protein